MKRLTILLCLLLILPAIVFSQALGPWNAAYGDWKLIDGRLVQLSTKAGMAQAYMKMGQTGVVQYEFDVRYVDGAQDNYAGFGVHIGIDRAHPRKSWGNGKSFLLWLTFDPAAYGGSGVYGQAYKSETSSVMNLMHRGDTYEIPAERLAGITVSQLDRYVLPVKIKVDYDTGWVKVYDPLIPNYYYKFTLGQPIRNGLYVSLRTNSLAASFGNLKVTKLASF